MTQSPHQHESPAKTAESKASLLGKMWKENPRLVVLRGAAAVLAVGLVIWLIVGIVDYIESRTLTLYGNVDIREVSLGFRVPGRIAEMVKDEGDAVSAGEVIARLDQEPYRDAYNEQAADVEVKRATWQNAQRIYERDSKLVGSGGISKEEFDNSVAARDEAAANLDLSKSKLASQQVSLDDTELHAPSDGVVLTRAQEPGAIVQAGNIVLTVCLNQPVWVRAYIPETHLGDVHPGREVEIYTDTQPNHPYHGKVGYVSPEAEFTPKSVETTQLRTSLVYRLRVVVSDPDPSLRQGMPVTVKISLR